MTRKRFHGLKRVKIRATWNKYNLYNLTRLKTPQTAFQTYYQQKWAAKSMTRAYHGEQIREKQWQRMFTPRLNSVIPMDHRYLAENDGSELAAGRGSGREEPMGKKKSGRNQIPYMHMTFAPIERRLDMAVFRALFASSARQARQLVTHGQVRVNGQKMPYPGYLLNPGDMFQVEPERVLFATGEIKTGQQAKESRHLRRKTRRWNARRDVARTKRLAEKAANTVTKDPSEIVAKSIQRKIPKIEAEERKERRNQFQELLKQARRYADNPRKSTSANKKKEVRAYIGELKDAMVKASRIDLKTLENNVLSLAARLSDVTDIKLGPRRHHRAEESESKGSSKGSSKSSSKSVDDFSPEEQKALQEAVARIRENPVDETMPYATPWRPRPFMSAFAFVPRYLEVNHNICSAVYLRHPVARPGLAEVPTPFPAETQQLAFNWYLRRR